MFEAAIESLHSILQDHAWIPDLAGILPLSALIDFIDVPLKLHVFELNSGVPLWSWPVTPAGSRLLLSDKSPQQPCCLDRYGNSVGLVAVDGRHGDEYFLSSPETFRLAIDSQSAAAIENLHANMNSGKDQRTQNLEIIYCHRTNPKDHREPSTSWWRHFALDPLRIHSIPYLAMSAVGWVALFGCIAMSVIFRYYLATAFFAAMPATGIVVYALYGSRPKRLLVDNESEFNRLIVVSEHMNSDNWIVVYGESTIVNSLVNRPLKAAGPGPCSPTITSALRLILRIMILGQWAMVIGAASTKDWNSFFISFWIIFCIFSHAFILKPTRLVKDWLRSSANLELHRYQTRVSSRRALLSTLLTLNPDTFAEVRWSRDVDRSELSKQATLWIDPILRPGEERTKWETATLEALNEVQASNTKLEDQTSDLYRSSEGTYLSANWHKKWRDTQMKNGAEATKDFYWKKYIIEGIYMAANIRLKAGLTGRRLTDNLV